MATFTTQDLLYIALSVGFLVLVGFLSYAAYHLAQALQSLKLVLDQTEDITRDVQKVKNQLKHGVISAVTAVLGMFLKKEGGENNGK